MSDYTNIQYECYSCSEKDDEIERLRAALERIAKDAPFSRYRAWEYQTIAREALREGRGE